MEYQEYTKIIDYFASINPQDLLRVDNSSIEEIVHILTGFILLYKNDPECKPYILEAAKILFLCIQNINCPIETKWALYALLKSSIMTIPFLKELSTWFQYSYEYLIEYIKYEVQMLNTDHQTSLIDFNCEESPIIIIAAQILSSNHSVTKVVLQYAKLIHKLGHPVLIINDSSLNYKNPDCIIKDFSFNSVEAFNNISSYEYDGINYPFYQLEGYMPDINLYSSVIDSILSLKPKLIFDIGGFGILSGLLADKVNSIALACAYDLPVSVADTLLLPRKITDED